MSEQREKFKERIEELVASFETAAREAEWVTKRYPKRIRDLDGGVYEVPSLVLQRGPIHLFLDPLHYNVLGAEAAADLSLMPTAGHQLSLYHEHGNWWMYSSTEHVVHEAHTITHADLVPVKPDSIVEALDSIAEHAVF